MRKMSLDTLKRRLLLCGAGLMVATAVIAPISAFADVSYKEYNGNSGVTDFTIYFSRNQNILFSVPTTIPLSLQADGTLVGPSSDEFKITNLSVYPIHMTGFTAKSHGAWTIVEDAMDSSNDKKWVVTDVQVGVGASMNSIYDASQGDGIDTCNDINYVMSPKGDSSSALKMKVTGHARNVTPGTVSGAFRVTWNLEAGAQHARTS